MIVVAYLWSQVTEFYARPFIWNRVSGLMRFRDGSDKGTASSFVQM
jgi:hypothetical protein